MPRPTSLELPQRKFQSQRSVRVRDAASLWVPWDTPTHASATPRPGAVWQRPQHPNLTHSGRGRSTQHLTLAHTGRGLAASIKEASEGGSFRRRLLGWQPWHKQWTVCTWFVGRVHAKVLTGLPQCWSCDLMTWMSWPMRCIGMVIFGDNLQRGKGHAHGRPWDATRLLHALNLPVAVQLLGLPS